MSQAGAPVACRPVREALDSYISAELGAPDIQGIGTHLEVCPPCAAECRARRLLRHELAAALISNRDTGPLEDRVLAAIETAAVKSARNRVDVWAAAVAAGLVLALVAWREPEAPRALAPPPPAAVVPVAATLYEETSHAHLMCAVRGEFAGPAPGRAKARLGLERFAPVLAALEPELAAGAILDTHVCSWPRPFGHVVLDRNGHRVSLLVTPEQPEALPVEGTLLQAPEQAIVRVLERRGFRLAASASLAHAGFVVSTLDAPEVAALGVRVLPQALRALGGVR